MFYASQDALLGRQGEVKQADIWKRKLMDISGVGIALIFTGIILLIIVYILFPTIAQWTSKRWELISVFQNHFVRSAFYLHWPKKLRQLKLQKPNSIVLLIFVWIMKPRANRAYSVDMARLANWQLFVQKAYQAKRRNEKGKT